MRELWSRKEAIRETSRLEHPTDTSPWDRGGDQMQTQLRGDDEKVSVTIY